MLSFCLTLWSTLLKNLPYIWVQKCNKSIEVLVYFFDNCEIIWMCTLYIWCWIIFVFQWYLFPLQCHRLNEKCSSSYSIVFFGWWSELVSLVVDKLLYSSSSSSYYYYYYLSVDSLQEDFTDFLFTSIKAHIRFI